VGVTVITKQGNELLRRKKGGRKEERKEGLTEGRTDRRHKGRLKEKQGKGEGQR